MSWSSGLFVTASKLVSTVREQAVKVKENALELSVKAKSEAVNIALDLKHQALVDRKYLSEVKLPSSPVYPSEVSSSMPWDHDDENICEVMRSRVLALSCIKETFFEDPPEEWKFDFKDYVHTATKLLQIDSNLQRRHSQFSMKIQEETFWRRYFYKCMQIREDVLHASHTGNENQEEPNNTVSDGLSHTEEQEATCVDSPENPIAISGEVSSGTTVSSWEEQLKADLGVGEFEFLQAIDDGEDCDLPDGDLEKQIAMELTSHGI